jgi:hypothetical protein
VSTGQSSLAALALLALATAVTSCATADADGCETDECRIGVAQAKARWAREDAARARQAAEGNACLRAEANPAGVDPGYLSACRLKRWQGSGIVCSDSRVDEKFIEVTCEVPDRGAPPDLATASEMLQKRAAVATLAAGRAYLALAGEEAPVIRYARRVLFCDRTTAFQSYDCSTTAPLPASATVRRRYELMNEADAAARTGPDIPAARRPQSAQQIAQAYAGLP